MGWEERNIKMIFKDFYFMGKKLIQKVFFKNLSILYVFLQFRHNDLERIFMQTNFLLTHFFSLSFLLQLPMRKKLYVFPFLLYSHIKWNIIWIWFHPNSKNLLHHLFWGGFISKFIYLWNSLTIIRAIQIWCIYPLQIQW